MSGVTSAAFGQMRRKTDALGYTFDTAIKRINDLEDRLEALDTVVQAHQGALEAYSRLLVGRTFLGRLVWLLRGR